MRLLKTSIDPIQVYVECEYKNIYPTYLLSFEELHVWSTCIPEKYRADVPIGYVYENT